MENDLVGLPTEEKRKKQQSCKIMQANVLFINYENAAS